MIPARRYAREIEAAWTKLLERPAVLGEKDWALICDWHARGIPIELIHEALDALGEKLPRRRRSPRNLGVVEPYVEEAWRTVREGRVSAGSAGERPADASVDPLDQWRRCASSRPVGDSLRAWLERLMERFAADGQAQACEKALSEGLFAHLPAEEAAELEASVDRDLAPFRDRMTLATWQATRRKALLSAARRRLGLPRLTERPAAR